MWNMSTTHTRKNHVFRIAWKIISRALKRLCSRLRINLSHNHDIIALYLLFLFNLINNHYYNFNSDAKEPCQAPLQKPFPNLQPPNQIHNANINCISCSKIVLTSWRINWSRTRSEGRSSWLQKFLWKSRVETRFLFNSHGTIKKEWSF